MEEINYGFIEEKPRLTDYIAGELSTIGKGQVRLKDSNWGMYLPDDERQNGVYFDTFGCVSFSALNTLEIQLLWLIMNNEIPADEIAWLRGEGYIDANNRPNFSDRFTAKMSGTGPTGNSCQNVADSVRTHENRKLNVGILPEKDWTWDPSQRTPVFSREEYYAEIPQKLKDKAKKFLDYFDITTEWVPTNDHDKIREAMQVAPLQLITYTCSPWNSGKPVAWCGAMKGNHAVTLVNLPINDKDPIAIYDHYAPFEKELQRGYTMFYLMRYVLTLRKNSMDEESKVYLAKNDNKLVQNTVTGELGLIKGGKVLVASPERSGQLAVTYLLRNGAGGGVPAELWEKFERAEF